MPQTNRVDTLAKALQRETRIKDLERELEALDPAALSAAERESWWHFYGIAAFREGRDADALARFQQGYNEFPGSARIKFGLGRQYIRARSLEKGFQLFRSCRFPVVSREYALAEARYAYLYSRYGDGLFFVRPFFMAYKQAKILDDHFLYVRGLPFFGQWWSYLAAFAILSGEFGEVESVTNFVTKNCHDYDFDYLQAQMRAYRYDKPEILLEPLEKRHSTRDGELPSGYTGMMVAVIKSRIAKSVDSAHEALSQVALKERDFPWIEDIRTLALAETAHRFGDLASERERLDAFLARQPMLFEPDIALDFHLLRYQEHLKSRVCAP